MPIMIFLLLVLLIFIQKQLTLFLGMGISEIMLEYDVLSIIFVIFLSSYLKFIQFFQLRSAVKINLVPNRYTTAVSYLFYRKTYQNLLFRACNYFLIQRQFLPILFTTFYRYAQRLVLSFKGYKKIVFCRYFLPMVEMTLIEILPFSSILMSLSF